MENSNYKKDNIVGKYLKTMRKNQFLEFIELKDKKLERGVKELCLKPIIISIDDMDRFEKK